MLMSVLMSTVVSYMHLPGMFMIDVSDGDVPDREVDVIVLLTSPGGCRV